MSWSQCGEPTRMTLSGSMALMVFISSIGVSLYIGPALLFGLIKDLVNDIRVFAVGSGYFSKELLRFLLPYIMAVPVNDYINTFFYSRIYNCFYFFFRPLGPVYITRLQVQHPWLRVLHYNPSRFSASLRCLRYKIAATSYASHSSFPAKQRVVLFSFTRFNPLTFNRPFSFTGWLKPITDTRRNRAKERSFFICAGFGAISCYKKLRYEQPRQ